MSERVEVSAALLCVRARIGEYVAAGVGQAQRVI